MQWSFKYETKPSVSGGINCLMSESFSHSFNWFIQTADSFRVETSDCLCEWIAESLTHSIRLKTWIHSVTKHRCCWEKHNSSAVALIGTIFVCEILQKVNIVFKM